jgi:hypothetical protein
MQFDFEDPPPPELDLNPLLDLFLDGSAPEGLLASATPQPAQNRLVLQLSDVWTSLGPSVRTAIAETGSSALGILATAACNLLMVSRRFWGALLALGAA